MKVLRQQLAALNVPIKRLVTDSRAVQDGDTFVAYPGEKMDGRQFIGSAIARGANAVIWEARGFAWDPSWQVANMGVADLRHQAGWLADAVYGSPSKKLWMVGVTGTNGKTSTSHWLAHGLNEAGRKCALIGTLGNGFVGALHESANTTPDAIRVHGLLNEYLEGQAKAVAMEVSSHALAQGRVNGVRFDVALLTNLSRDHLDYHGDMQSYAAAKRKLFEWSQLKYAVLNLDDAYGAEMAEGLQRADVEVIGYGLSEAAVKLAGSMGLRMVYGELLDMNSQGLKLSVHCSWGAAQLSSSLIGRFNAANLLGVLAVLLVSEIDLNTAVRALASVQPAAGRMQRLGGLQQPTVIIDYAHTPDALEKVLYALHEVNEGGNGKLVCVFGCGGDRDRGKRPMMGLIAEKFSDYCIVTSDNPRSENPQSIIAEIVGGMVGLNHEEIIDRELAIKRAVIRAKQGDTVLIAGKGHENYQEIRGVRNAFSDVSIAKQALDQWRGGES